MSKPIHQTVIFKATPHAVYEALMDTEKHAAFTGSKANLSRQIGGEISAYDGYISGQNVELVPEKKIVQTWRAVDWPEGFFSQVTFEMSVIPEGTRLDFSHTGLPEGTEDEFAQGWQDNYWDPLKKFLER